MRVWCTELSLVCSGQVHLTCTCTSAQVGGCKFAVVHGQHNALKQPNPDDSQSQSCAAFVVHATVPPGQLMLSFCLRVVSCLIWYMFCRRYQSLFGTQYWVSRRSTSSWIAQKWGLAVLLNALWLLHGTRRTSVNLNCGFFVQHSVLCGRWSDQAFCVRVIALWVGC